MLGLLNRNLFSPAAMLLKNYDSQIDPCDDFYNFSCGGFIKSMDIPDGSLQLHQFDILSELITKQLKSIVDKPIKNDDIDAIRKSKTLYQSCMNEGE